MLLDRFLGIWSQLLSLQGGKEMGNSLRPVRCGSGEAEGSADQQGMLMAGSQKSGPTTGGRM